MIRIISLFLLCLPIACSCSVKNPQGLSLDVVQHAFTEVPDSVRLAVYWYWISDNISKEGVIADLESMKEAGINRAFIGNIGLDEMEYGPHKILSDEWWEITRAALKRAGELDIEIGIFNSPGWSQSGGPWVEQGQSMRYLASSYIDVKGPSQFSDPLPEIGGNAQEVRVIAYPLPETQYPAGRWTVEKMHGQEVVLDMKMPAGAKARSLSVDVDRSTHTFGELYVKEGEDYRLLRKVEIDRSNTGLGVGFIPLPPVVISIPESFATEYRFKIAAPGRAIMEVTLSSEPIVERWPEKTFAKMFQTPLPMWDAYLWDAQPDIDPLLAVDPAAVIDISPRFKNGILEWEVPEGNWRILRTGMLPTGVTNAPASPEGRGLETDKMSKAHIAAHFNAFIGEILRRIPPEDRRTFKVVVQDSYETGGQNWTDDMAERFENVYGYDPVPFLPVLYGTVVGSPDMSDRFLWDLRRLVADRVSYDYVGGLREESAKHGLKTWLENYGHWGFPGEFLQYGGQSDEVAGEYWSEGTLGDIENRAASSAAHIHGKRDVWAECFTAAGNSFGRYPYLMKQRGDRFFTEGINSVLLHVFIHQPYEDRFPGMNAWFGNEFNRNNTWYGQMHVFMDYLKRNSFILKQGSYVADVAYFIGEDTPKMTGVCDPVLPRGYSFDYINGEVLHKYSRVKDGKLVLNSGMEYSVLVLPRLTTMRPEMLERISEMVREGLVVLGPAPVTSPSLSGWPSADEKVARLAGDLWHGVTSTSYAKVGKGYVFGEDCSLEDVFAVLDISPDFDARTGDNILFIHRSLDGGDVYLISNQEERKVSFEASFRTQYGKPKLWDAITGEVRYLPSYTEADGRVSLNLELEPYGSYFVVFRGSKGSGNGAGGNFPKAERLAGIEGPWTVTFDGIVAPDAPVMFDRLTDWTTSSDPAVRYFSGTATYETTFTVTTLPEKETYIDLGDIMVMGKVWINGEYAGGAWTYPYRVNISDLLKEGENTLTVEVANNWKNRLVGDQLLPEGERKTWTPVNPWTADSDLQSSGLMGPVTIVAYDYSFVE